MHSFEFYNPVKIVWGHGSVKSVGDYISKNEKILVVYGGGSIYHNGVYDQIAFALKDHDTEFLGGIEPNPTLETCLKFIEKIRTEGFTFLLAVGGGSVIDSAKFIAVASLLDAGADPWTIMTGEYHVENALPFAAVVTLPATGSEMNNTFVISKATTKEKRVTACPSSFPIFSILDPLTTISLPYRQTANGIADAYIHILEQYLTMESDTPVQDSWAEGLLRTLIATGPALLEDLEDVGLRENVMYCAVMALNGMIAMGVQEDWATHRIGHELTALYGIDHARSLTVVLPALLHYRTNVKKEKLISYAKQVLGLSIDDESALIDTAIQRTKSFFSSMGLEVSLAEASIPEEAPSVIADRFRERGETLGEENGITADDVEKILFLSL